MEKTIPETVVLNLNTYDELKEDINYAYEQMEEMKKEHEKEIENIKKEQKEQLKNICKLQNSYQSLNIVIDEEEILKYVYGDSITFKGVDYEINKKYKTDEEWKDSVLDIFSGYMKKEKVEV